jgi:acetyl esterase/lipase
MVSIPAMKGKKLYLFPVLSLCLKLFSSEPEIFQLWPTTAPGEIEGEVGEEEYRAPKPGSNDVLRIANVSEPTISLFKPRASKSNGTTVIVCPGGGYNILAYEHEGTQVCEWLNDLGVTAVLLKYRVPRRKNRPPHEAPLQDLQRAIALVRENAKSWKINPEKVGVLGFSAGGNLVMMGVSSFDKRSYAQVDKADKFSCRPDFGILIYPAYLVDRKKRSELLPEIHITSRTPPCFFAHTGDDHVPGEGSVLAYLALEKAGVSGNELHIFPFGGHGYGIRKTTNPVSQWPRHAAKWMESMKLLELK